MSDVAVTQLAWDGRLDAERNYRYYHKLAAQYNRMSFWISVTLACSAFAAGSTLLFSAHPLISAALSFVATACSIVLLIAELPAKAAQADAASNHYKRVAIEWKRLWWDQSDDDAKERAFWIETFADSGPEVNIAENEQLNVASGQEAIEVVTAEYTTA